ncbi:unnamed protein product [Urochloa decumbens]|uniref:Uncharacterized protein n=1 Tax=Urochloa decumbens TaxID=240449 RepID=A0ABC8VI51_9POAL
MASHPLLLLATVSMLFDMASGQDDDIPPPSGGDAFSCSYANYTNGSQYKKNLDRLLDTLPTAAADNGRFYKDSAGAGADEVFGLIMCFADWNATECRECLAGAAAGIKRECPGSRSVRAMYDACMLRYSAAPIPPTADLGAIFEEYAYGEPVTSLGLANALMRLMAKLTAGVTASPLLLANDTAPYSSSQTMYGLAQCTRDLNATECTRCINDYVDRLVDMYPNKTGGAMKGYSCYLRYQVGTFQITLPTMPPQQPTYHGIAELFAHASTERSSTGLAIGLPIGAVFMIVLASLIWLHRLRRQKRGREQEQELEELLPDDPAMEDEFQRGRGPKRFLYGELATAADNFSDSEKLGEGGFGSVYKGFLREMNLHVAIKRLSNASEQGRKEFISEVRTISRLRHRNLVQLIGYSNGRGELLLVYELMPKGSLDKHLYRADNRLSWSVRYKIVLEIASAVLYLHQEWDREQCVLHRDIKPSNVMLDASFNAKLGDFGLARLVDHGRGSHTTELFGTIGYMDPECMVDGRFSTESDTYSFGVLLLEVACGRQPVVVRDGAQVHLARRVLELHDRGMVLDAADRWLNGVFNAGEMECVLLVGLWCTHQDRSQRPSIREAVSVLRFEAPLPSLPARMPVATNVPVPAGLLNSVASLAVDDSDITRTDTMYLSTTTS